MSARGRSQALRCPSKRGSSSSYLDFRLYPVDSSLRGTELAQLAAQSALDADVDVVSRQHCGCAVGLTEIAGDVLTDTRVGDGIVPLDYPEPVAADWPDAEDR